MSEIKVFTAEQAEEWEKLVKSFTSWDVYYLPGYTKAFQANGDGDPLLFYYEEKGMRAVNVVMKRPVPVKRVENEADEALREYCDFVTPYGYGGFLFDGGFTPEAAERMFQAYEAFCVREKAAAEFVRFHPVLENAHKTERFYEVVDLGATVKMDTSSKETIWQNMTSKNRNMIRKALKSGVRIRWGRDERLFLQFEEIYNATMDKVGADDYYYFDRDFYRSILEDLKYNALIFYAELQGKIIAMSILLFGGSGAHYHLSASRKEFQNLAPTNLILFEAACFACEMGKRTLHLGGGLGSRRDHLYSFKKQFNRYEDCTFSIGRKIYNQEVYDRLCRLNGADRESGFFPAYRKTL